MIITIFNYLVYVFVYYFLLAPYPIWGLSRWLSGKESTSNAGGAGDTGLIPWSGRSPVVGNGNPLQDSCLDKPMGRGAWHGDAKSPPWTEDPWGCKELDRNQHPSMHTLFYFQLFTVCFSSFHMNADLAGSLRERCLAHNRRIIKMCGMKEWTERHCGYMLSTSSPSSTFQETRLSGTPLSFLFSHQDFPSCSIWPDFNLNLNVRKQNST